MAGARTAVACALAGSKLSSKSSAWAAVPLTRAAQGAAQARALADRGGGAGAPASHRLEHPPRHRLGGAGDGDRDDVDEGAVRGLPGGSGQSAGVSASQAP